MAKKKEFYSVSNDEFYKNFEEFQKEVKGNFEHIITKIDSIKIQLSNHLAHHQTEEEDRTKTLKWLAIGISLFSILVTVIIKLIWK